MLIMYEDYFQQKEQYFQSLRIRGKCELYKKLKGSQYGWMEREKTNSN